MAIELIGGSKGNSGLNFGRQTLDALKGHNLMMGLHYQILSCHCECMGMMSENQAAPSKTPPYKMKDFKKSMIKYGILDKDGKVNI